ncbi:GTPase family protein [Photobacterium sp. J15]|uniref:GTPase family protein n=1 Tax=Photobacterium sp. J15 TaxID=265901 RepID=UPI0007E33A44|nr:GTPase [Photobacterium sp. J15]
MKKARGGINFLTELSGGIVPLFLALLVIPTLILAIVGAVTLVQLGGWLWFALLLALSSLIVAIPYFYLVRQRKAEKLALEALPGYQVKPSGQWSDFDNKVWDELNLRVETLLALNSEWGMMRPHAFQLVADAAGYYFPDKADKELAFTAPEFLLMVEEVSQRYRQFLLDHVPFAEKVRLRTLVKGYEQKDKIGVAKQAYDIYRVFRAMTPAGLIAEARGQILGRIFEDVSEEVQGQLKRVLLQEVVAVAIDLYSGRFAARESELGQSQVSADDQSRFAAEIEPLRIAVVGQVSAGKSSLINAISGNMVAEVHVLPSTDEVTVHRCEVDGIDLVHLVDLPGIDGNLKTAELLIDQMTNSDLIFWVVKANQPARKLDVELRKQLDAFYQDEKHIKLKRPMILALVNQVDRLKPTEEWTPPYDIVQPNSAKAEVIRAALEYNRQQLIPDEIMAVAVLEGQPDYNIEHIVEFLLENYPDGANTQLNRRRIEHKSAAIGDQITRLYRLVERAFKEFQKEI